MQRETVFSANELKVGINYFSEEEKADLNEFAMRMRECGAKRCGVFGSALVPFKRRVKENGQVSDIDVLVVTENAPIYGEVAYDSGERTNVLIHIFFKRPGRVEGISRRAEILNEAQENAVFFF